MQIRTNSNSFVLSLLVDYAVLTLLPWHASFVAADGASSDDSAAATAVPAAKLALPPYGPPGLYLSRVRPIIGSTRFDVTKFGAMGNNHANDTLAIQRSLDACAMSATGGVVLFPNARAIVWAEFVSYRPAKKINVLVRKAWRPFKNTCSFGAMFIYVFKYGAMHRAVYANFCASHDLCTKNIHPRQLEMKGLSTCRSHFTSQMRRHARSFSNQVLRSLR